MINVLYRIEPIKKPLKTKKSSTPQKPKSSNNVGINLNVRDKKQLVLPMMRKLTSYLENQDFSTVHRIFDSVCGSYTKTKNKLWIIDLDNFTKEDITSSIIDSFVVNS